MPASTATKLGALLASCPASTRLAPQRRPQTSLRQEATQIVHVGVDLDKGSSQIAILTEDGLAAALESLVSRTPFPVDLTAEEERLSPQVEATVYFVACEALVNVAKHADASGARVVAQRHNGSLVVEVEDDGVGGASAESGSGLRGLADRVEALGGRLRVESPSGGGTRVVAEIPCAS